jgi:hypothetical protein
MRCTHTIANEGRSRASSWTRSASAKNSPSSAVAGQMLHELSDTGPSGMAMSLGGRTLYVTVSTGLETFGLP